MAYDDIKDDFGRRPVWIAELFLQKCLLTYSVLPCEAAIGVTGETKCYNTLATCQDTPNFDPDTSVPLRFSSERVDGIQAADEAPTFPSLLSIDTTPTRLEPGKGLGIRSRVNLKLEDHPWTDVGIDPYLGEATRPVQDPDSQGSFWGKLLARNKFWEGRRIDIITGYLDTETGAYDASNFLRRTYLIESIAGPDRNGEVSIIAKDPLKFADNDRVQVPTLTEATLDADINDVVTSFDVGAGEGALYTIGDFIRVDEEIMEVTGITVDTLDVDRATLPSFYPTTGTRGADHDAGATVQICRLYDNERADDIISELLITDAGIDATFIDTGDWADTFDTEIPSYIFSTLITEPVGVKDLLQELTEHTILIWWDEREQLIQFDVLRPAAIGTLPEFNDAENIVADSFASSRISKQRISRVFTYFGQLDPTVDLNTKNNFQLVDSQIDLDAETAEEYGSSRTLDIFSRWLPTAKAAVASEISQRMLFENRDTKINVTFVVDPKDDGQWTAEFVRINTRYVQDENGLPLERQYRIIEVEELLTKAGVRYKYVATQTQLDGRAGSYAPDEDPVATPYPTYTDASEEQRVRAFWADDDGKMANGDTGYVWT